MARDAIRIRDGLDTTGPTGRGALREAWAAGDLTGILDCYGDDFTLYYVGDNPFSGDHFTECWLYEEDQPIIDAAWRD